ncbi:hypothetical protein AVEN_176136-1 [Araneus ventricosus]|uniref:Uncharacterized protein n=1 Tax=Araneus ventricosus TaxID=182803 RepID=A0A4Y2RAX6_ARAVE|nr:hypothetical protein AVEN_176136-1 [Araneus ventricosus]
MQGIFLTDTTQSNLQLGLSDEIPPNFSRELMPTWEKGFCEKLVLKGSLPSYNNKKAGVENLIILESGERRITEDFLRIKEELTMIRTTALQAVALQVWEKWGIEYNQFVETAHHFLFLKRSRKSAPWNVNIFLNLKGIRLEFLYMLSYI